MVEGPGIIGPVVHVYMNQSLAYLLIVLPPPSDYLKQVHCVCLRLMLVSHAADECEIFLPTTVLVSRPFLCFSIAPVLQWSTKRSGLLIPMQTYVPGTGITDHWPPGT